MIKQQQQQQQKSINLIISKAMKIWDGRLIKNTVFAFSNLCIHFIAELQEGPPYPLLPIWMLSKQQKSALV